MIDIIYVILIILIYVILYGWSFRKIGSLANDFGIKDNLWISYIPYGGEYLFCKMVGFSNRIFFIWLSFIPLGIIILFLQFSLSIPLAIFCLISYTFTPIFWRWRIAKIAGRSPWEGVFFFGNWVITRREKGINYNKVRKEFIEDKKNVKFANYVNMVFTLIEFFLIIIAAMGWIFRF